ncbi:hypothetical protein [Methanococcoides methylutens]|nr:hypothetical protein [Methanococcoides methylutens]
MMSNRAKQGKYNEFKAKMGGIVKFRVSRVGAYKNERILVSSG